MNQVVIHVCQRSDPILQRKPMSVSRFFADDGVRYMTKDDLQVFSVHSMCSNVRNNSVVHLRIFSPYLWITTTTSPLPVGRGVCYIAFSVGVRSFLSKASVDGFN